MEITSKVFKIADSYAVILPVDIVRNYNIKKGDRIMWNFIKKIEYD